MHSMFILILIQYVQPNKKEKKKKVFRIDG